jgi:hypothetical protein
MARVGRRAGELNVLYDHDTAAVASDAVFIISCADANAGYIAAMLQTEFVISHLRRLRRGSTVEMISLRDLCSVPLPVLDTVHHAQINEASLGRAADPSRLTLEIESLWNA